MRQVQDKIMRLIREIVENAGAECLDQGDAASTGRVYVQRDLATLVIAAYSFQGDYCTADLTGPAVARLLRQGTVTDNATRWRVMRPSHASGQDNLHSISYRVRYDDQEALKGLLAHLKAAITGASS